MSYLASDNSPSQGADDVGVLELLPQQGLQAQPCRGLTPQHRVTLKHLDSHLSTQQHNSTQRDSCFSARQSAAGLAAVSAKGWLPRPDVLMGQPQQQQSSMLCRRLDSYACKQLLYAINVG